MKKSSKIIELSQADLLDGTATSVKTLSSSCFSTQSFREMKSICMSKLEQMRLSAFEFARVYDDGTALILYSDPKTANYVVEKKIHITAHVPASILSNQFWYLPEENGSYVHQLRDIKELVNAQGFINYIQRFVGYFDMFSFLSPQDQNSASNYFVNSKETLEQFCYEFRERATSLIASVNQDRFKVHPDMATNFKGLTKANSIVSNNLDLFIKRIRQELEKVSSNMYPKLSAREQDCVHLLILGKTSTEIASDLLLSPRTVEMYLNSVKNKLGCEKKSQIITSILRRAS